jgi:multidrug efflux system membrane fusion protein
VSDQVTERNGVFGRTADKARDAAGRAGRWSDDHVPGGQRVFWIGLGLILLALLIWFLYPSPNSTSRRGQFGGPQAVGVAKVTTADVPVTINALGTVTPIATVTVRPQVSGQILRFDVQEGQMVKAGDVLAEIDPRTFQAALEQAQGVLAKDQAALENARIDAQRYASLLKLNAISNQIYATQVALVHQDEGTVKSDVANVDSAKINLLYCKITSPVAGRVGLRQVDVGNLVETGQTTGVIVVTQIQPISVLFSVPEDDVDNIVSQIRSGQKLSVDAYDRTQTTKLATGSLETLDNQIDPTTGTVKLRANFDNADAALFPQQFVNVKLLVQTLHNQIVVPAAAIERGSSGSFVYVVNSDSTVSVRSVTLGASQGSVQSVTQGLKVGEVVVTDGADRLKDGADVIVPKQNGKPEVSTAASSSGTPSASDAERAKRRAAMAAAMKQYCSEDIAKYCPNLKPGAPEMRQCFFENMSSFSDTCQTALKKLRHGGGHHHGGGGGGGG